MADITHFRFKINTCLIGAFTVRLTIVLSNYRVLTAYSWSLSGYGADLLHKTAKIGRLHICED